MPVFADFEILIAESASGAADMFPVRVTSSPAGPAEGVLQLPLNDADFRAKLALACSGDSPPRGEGGPWGPTVQRTFLRARPRRMGKQCRPDARRRGRRRLALAPLH
jgi:hypothetical protein